MAAVFGTQDRVHFNGVAKTAKCEFPTQSFSAFFNFFLAGDDKFTTVDRLLYSVVFVAVKVFDLLDGVCDSLRVL